ncbi:BQ2448_7602 [Microbotryum intermedium]|uniref:BQ2448_7602 protein n=1 Tax=Microbotryum intermedium TaxID=269621 RepID=A0A238FRH4_9BASI|nr:BQ2448_7602 [Microbotryum intermedium]
MLGRPSCFWLSHLARPYIFLGYDLQTKGYWVYDPDTQLVHIACNIRF